MAAPVGSCYEKWLFRKTAVQNKKLFQKIVSLIANLKVLHWKGTVPHNNYSGTNSKNI